MKIIKNCCSKSAGSTKPYIWADLGVIVGWWVRSIEPKILVRSEVIMGGLRVNFCCLLLLIRLIFISTEGVICWNK